MQDKGRHTNEEGDIIIDLSNEDNAKTVEITYDLTLEFCNKNKDLFYEFLETKF